ncbi:hypothetical protein [Salinimicrobium soli]|uniref:hypothetical protein n=1 Tax=Salinimicrobium soli TaxID=1254399 RepID=UPI003AAE0467
MKNSIPLLFLLLSLTAFSQSFTTKDNIEIEIKKSRTALNNSPFQASLLKVKGEDFQKVLVRTRIKSDKNNKTQLSGFSLVDPQNQIRYRLADYKGYNGIIGAPEFIPFRKTQFFNKSGRPASLHVPFDIEEKDLFEEYNMPGYTNFEVPINFGKDRLSVVYFGQTDLKKLTAELFFTIPQKYLGLPYHLYYRDEKVAEVYF